MRKKRYKILYVCDENFSLKDAKRTHVLEVVKNLKRVGNKVILLSQNEFKEISLLDRIYFQIGLIQKIRRITKEERIDLIYVRQNPILFIPHFIAKLLKIPTIVEYNGTSPEELKLQNRPKFILAISKMIEKYSVLNSSKVIVNSIGLGDHLREKYFIDKNKIHVVGMGVDSNKFLPLDKISVRKKLNFSKEFLYLSYIGGLDSWQGVDYIIKSIKRVSKIFPNIKLLIVGDGFERNNLDKLVYKENLDNKIFFLGRKDQKKVVEYINASDICLCYLTRFKEGKYGPPTKVYEYMACETPIILSDIKGVKELFKNNVILAKPENERDLSNKIISLLKNNKLRNKLGKRGRKFVVKEYTWDKIAKKYLKVFEEVVKENKKK